MNLLRRRGAEWPARPLHGYKLGYPMLSADGAEAGFRGVALGRGVVYAPTADAVCVQAPRHRCPARGCDCGFYCLHDLDDARALAADPGNQQAVLLEVTASGRYIRYERGLRYSRQVVRAVRVGRCDCGHPGAVLADAGGAAVGWRRLAATCHACVGDRPVLALDAFARLSGAEVTVDPAVAASARGFGAHVPDHELLPQLTAEVTLLQARLDEVVSQIDRLSRNG